MIEPQQFPQLEAAEARIARCDRAIQLWRDKGLAYVSLRPDGVATPHEPGTLALLLRYVAANPAVRIVELCASDARQNILSWALTSRPVATDPKGSN